LSGTASVRARPLSVSDSKRAMRESTAFLFMDFPYQHTSSSSNWMRATIRSRHSPNKDAERGAHRELRWLLTPGQTAR
jgi:ABC-type polar amino acid transport system ATPase subunit